eukprot:356647-Chlamydomonas_euryale.AAC.9
MHCRCLHGRAEELSSSFFSSAHGLCKTAARAPMQWVRQCGASGVEASSSGRPCHAAAAAAHLHGHAHCNCGNSCKRHQNVRVDGTRACNARGFCQLRKPRQRERRSQAGGAQPRGRRGAERPADGGGRQQQRHGVGRRRDRAPCAAVADGLGKAQQTARTQRCSDGAVATVSVAAAQPAAKRMPAAACGVLSSVATMATVVVAVATAAAAAIRDAAAASAAIVAHGDSGVAECVVLSCVVASCWRICGRATARSSAAAGRIAAAAAAFRRVASHGREAAAAGPRRAVAAGLRRVPRARARHRRASIAAAVAKSLLAAG